MVVLGDVLVKIDGYKVIFGDMNLYGMEDFMLVLMDYILEKYGKIICVVCNIYIAGLE